MPIYKYTGDTMLVVKIKGVRYNFAVGHHVLKSEMELPEKIDLSKYNDLELVDDGEMKKSKKRKGVD